MKFVVNFTNNYCLKYDLIDHEIVDSWSNLIMQHDESDLCKNNYYLGFASKDAVQEKINRLYYLADLINSHVPNRVIKRDILLDDYSESLSVMHVHFPDLKNKKEYEHIWSQLTEYNDIIHWLEATLPALDKSFFFRITLDFNKSNATFLPIPESAYSLFTSECNFGDLKLHYIHVGKNANEIFITNDLVCPPDQFVPQNSFSASVRMHFYNYFHNTAEQKQRLKNNWEQFYEARGGKEFWGYEIDDPKLAFGFLKIGELVEISINGNKQKIPTTEKELDNFRNSLVQCLVTDWIIE